MWTLYMKDLTPRKNVQKKKKATSAFPPISKATPTMIARTTRSSSWADQGTKSVQKLFFSLNISDAQKLLYRPNSLKDVSLEDCHWNIPYKKISGETSIQVTSHLKNSLYHRRVKRINNEADAADENPYILESTESFLLKRPAVQEDYDATMPSEDYLGELHPRSPESNTDTCTEEWSIIKNGATPDLLQEGTQQNQPPTKDTAKYSLGINGHDTNGPTGSGGEYKHFKGLYINHESCEKQEEHQRLSDKDGVIQGFIDTPYVAKKKVFMVYICGGYQDSFSERNALFTTCYPELYIYFKERGIEFRMLDLRYGLKDGISDDHVMASLQLTELQKCQTAGHGAFFCFIGQKYDQMMIPAILTKESFEKVKALLESLKMEITKQKLNRFNDNGLDREEDIPLLVNKGVKCHEYPDEQNVTDDFTSLAAEGQDEREKLDPIQKKTTSKYDKDLTLLTQWYKLDENVVPSVYRLQAISSQYRDMYSRDPGRRQQAKSKWIGTMQRLNGILQEYSQLALGKEECEKILKPVLHQEIDQALTAGECPEDYFYCFKRIISDMKYNLSSNRACDYIDLHPIKPEINKSLYDAQQALIKGIHQRVHHTNISEYKVSFGSDGINPVSNKSHAHYLESLCNEFKGKVIDHFSRLTGFPTLPENSWNRKQFFRTQRNEEILEHARHGHTLLDTFLGRQSFLESFQECIKSGNRRLVVLHGQPGSGKSALMAKLAFSARQWIGGDSRVVVRFIGATGESRNLCLLLQSLCYQIADIYSHSKGFSENIKCLINEFSSVLEFAHQSRPLIIILDGIDELSENSVKLSWIPSKLPPHVYFIVSMSSGNESDCTSFQHLKELQVELNAVQIPLLSSAEINNIIEFWLRQDQHKLTSRQKEALIQTCTACPAPLFVMCAYMESRRWTSYTPDNDIHLIPSIPKMFSWILSRLERLHGEQVVKKAVSYISLSRNGITQEELLDLLSLDQSVMDEIRQYQAIIVPVFPESLWIKLRSDFGTFLVEQRTDNSYVINWSHKQLRLICLGRYVKSKDEHLAIHSVFANYYLEGGTRHKPINSDMPMMPLSWLLKQEDRTVHVLNLRQIRGISYHLIQSDQISRLITECIFNYEYLLHKTWATSVTEIQEDIKAAINPERPSPELLLISETLQLSTEVLLRDPTQLASQLRGRLHQIEALNKPMSLGDPRKYLFLPLLLSQCLQSSIPTFVPSFTCLLPPGGIPYDTIAGHTDNITAVAEAQAGPQAVTASKDGTLKVWDLEAGKAVFTLHGVWKNINSITVCSQNKIVAITEENGFQIWDLYQEKMLYAAHDILDAPILTTALDGQLLLAFFDGSHIVKVFDLADSCKLICQVDIPADEIPVHKNHSILVSKNSVKDYIMFAYRSGKEAMVLSARRGAVVSKLTAQDPVASVQGVAVTKDYFLLICRYPSLRYHDIIHIELFSVNTFAYIRTVKGCGNDFITRFSVNRQGSHLVAFSHIPNTNTTEIVVWNLESEDHKHMVKFSSVPIGGICFDLQYCLALTEGENVLRLWNLANHINDQRLTVYRPKITDGIQEIVTMKKFPRYAICRSVRPGVITVWNIVNSKCKGSAVRVERGLMENTDVVLVRDMMLYILTNRGMASFTDTPRPIFQTLWTYDVLKKKYVRKQTGLYIIPCPKHEYRILDGGLLLGLSENRDHFVIWNMETGFIKDRLRPNFKDKQSALDPVPKHDLQKENKGVLQQKKRLKDTVLLTPWERRNETKTAKRRRKDREVKFEIEVMQQLANEKSNAIDQYLLSESEKVIVCSYYAHHLCVFSLETMSHVHTLEDSSSMLFLHNAALTYDGSYLVISNYCDVDKISYVTLWDLQSGMLKKRLKNEPNICCMAITDTAERIVFAVTTGNKLKVWDPFRHKHKVIPGYETLNLTVESKIQIIEEGSKAVLLAGDVSLWNLDNGTVVSVFTPDSRICCLSLASDRQTILLGMSDTPSLITLKIASKEKGNGDSSGAILFGEESTSSEDEPDDQEPL
ncbi:uncharacterized protein PAF06_003294 [Gastrophryne carolinensis]